MPHLTRNLCLFVVLLAAGSVLCAGPADPPFPRTDPAAVGIPAKALELLAGHMQELVDGQEIVGGELLVIKNRRTVFREAFGWKDRESGTALEPDAVYCVRSMTKPLVGTAIQMLVDEGRLKLETPVREILPFFDGPLTGKITVGHLMHHTGGFPFTTLSQPLADYADLAAVAAEAADTELLFEPGSRFEYSDAGSDTLGAIVEKITGSPVERFIEKRILKPLGMNDTTTLLGDNAKVKARIPSAYSGGTGSWAKHWEPSDPPIFPLFLTSQSLYTTTVDYARFLALWMDGGKVGNKRLLSPAAVDRGLAAAHAMDDYPRGFGGLGVYYGQQWMVYGRSSDTGSPEPVLFGHGGSDGTHAWAWPEQDLIVLFFTQSRGTLAGLGMEPVLQTLLIDQKLDDPSLLRRKPTAGELRPLAGMYWDETNATAYYIVTPRENGLIVERPGSFHLVFKADKTPGRFVHEVNAQVWIEFLRGEDGSVDFMRYAFGGPVETGPRFTPGEGLPTAAQAAGKVNQAHGIDRLPDLGIVRVSGTLNYQTRKMEGTLTTLFDTDRERTEVRIGSMTETVVKNGDRAWSENTTAGNKELAGAELEQALLDRYPVRFGGWIENYKQVEVLKRIPAGGGTILLVRVVPHHGPGATMYIHEETGLLRRMDSLSQIPGLGVVGAKTRFQDFRDVGGMQIPFQVETDFATPMIGKVVITVEKAETGIESAEDLFAPPAQPSGDGTD